MYAITQGHDVSVTIIGLYLDKGVTIVTCVTLQSIRKI